MVLLAYLWLEFILEIKKHFLLICVQNYTGDDWEGRSRSSRQHCGALKGLERAVYVYLFPSESQAMSAM